MSDANKAATVTTNAAENKDAQNTEVKSAADTLYHDANAQQDAPKDAQPAAPENKDKPADQSNDAQKVDAQKADSENKDEAVKAPEKYVFEVDDDSLVTDEHLERIAQISKERGLSQEAAQKLVDLQAETLKGHNSRLLDDHKKSVEAWKTTAQADKEIGGENFSRNVELAKRVVDKFASNDFKKALNDTGFGNHPELLRTFVRIANAMSEDSLVVPGSNQTARAKTYEDLFYGSNT